MALTTFLATCLALQHCALASWADIDLATANLRNEALRDQMQAATAYQTASESFQDEMNRMQRQQPSFSNYRAASGYGYGLTDAQAQRPLPPTQFRQAVAHETLSRPDQVSALAEQLELASQRLAVQQRLAALRLQEAKMLDDLATTNGLQRQRTAPEVADLALAQTRTRHSNPVVAAALLVEPAMYGYYLLLWLGFMVVTGISSAFCMYLGKLPFRRGATEELPNDSESGRLPHLSSGRQGVPSGPSSHFQYPGSSVNHTTARERLFPPQASKKLDNEPDEEPDGVETWVRVPVKSAPQRNENRQCFGYVDESDGEAEHYIKPARGRHALRGLVDEC